MLKNRFSGLTSYGLLGFLILSWALPITCLFNFQAPSRGWRVHILKDLSVVKTLPGNMPPVVRIDKRHQYFVNSQRISPKELQSAIQEALRLRFDKVMFVYADPEVDYDEVLVAIDAASVLHAHVVLITSLKNANDPTAR